MDCYRLKKVKREINKKRKSDDVAVRDPILHSQINSGCCQVARSFFVQVSYICRLPYLHHGVLRESNYL